MRDCPFMLREQKKCFKCFVTRMWPSFMNGWWWCSLQIPLENDVRLVTTIWVILVQYLCAWNLCYMYYIYISITTMFLWFILGTSDGFHGTTHRVSGYNTQSLIVNYNAYRVWRIVSATKCYFSSLINFPSFHSSSGSQTSMSLLSYYSLNCVYF